MPQSSTLIVGIVIVLCLMVLLGMEQPPQGGCEKHPYATRCKAARHETSNNGLRAVQLF